MNLKYVVLVVLCVFGFVPLSASAASVYLEASRNTISVGDTAVVTVKINAEGAVLNTVEGDVSLKSSNTAVAVDEFSLANSAFGLWPRTPSLSKDRNTISFVAGVPGGFSIEGATLFKIIVNANKEGTVTLFPSNMSVFANDGKGTKVPVTVKGVTLNVQAKKSGVPVNNEWQGIVSGDLTPPEDFLIVLGQDPSLFDNKKFAFFSALDNQSGIDYYDVSEDGAPAVRSGSTYVLKNQDENVKLSVTAYDKAGNKKVAQYTGGGSRPVSWPFVITVVLVVVVGWFIFKKWRKSKKNASISY